MIMVQNIEYVTRQNFCNIIVCSRVGLEGRWCLGGGGSGGHAL